MRIARAWLPAVLAAAILLPARASGPPVRAQERAPRVRVALDEAIAADAAGVAARLPGAAEQIEAGETRITLPGEALAALRDAGLPFDVLGAAPALQAGWPRCVSTLDQLLAWARELASERPELVTLLDIGDSGCKMRGGCVTPNRDRLPGDDIFVLRISAQGGSGGQPGSGPGEDPGAGQSQGRLLVDAGMHAREVQGPEMIKAFATHLVRGYGVDPELTWLLDHREIYLGLATNPDGRRIVELGTRPPYDEGPWYQRKNGNDTRGRGCPWPPTIGSQYGVDLNRNHPFQFDASGHSRQPCDETYRGEGAASEAETQAYNDFARSIFPDQRGPATTDVAPRSTTGLLINLHSYTSRGTVLVPWGWTSERAPNDEGLAAIAARYADRVGYGWQYALYPVSGNTRDWGYGELGIPSYVIELRDEDFFPNCAALPGRLAANLPGLELAANLSDQPYARIRGPEITELVAEIVDGGAGLRVRATADDGAHGTEGVAAAEVLIDRQGGLDGSAGVELPLSNATHGLGWPMAALDGRFDAVVEALSATLRTDTIGPGRWYVVARARDEAGSWGPSRSTWLNVDGPTWTPPPPATQTPTATATPTATSTPDTPATAVATVTATSTATTTATATSIATSAPSASHTPRPDRTSTATPPARVTSTAEPGAPVRRIFAPFALR